MYVPTNFRAYVNIEIILILIIVSFFALFKRSIIPLKPLPLLQFPRTGPQVWLITHNACELFINSETHEFSFTPLHRCWPKKFSKKFWQSLLLRKTDTMNSKYVLYYFYKWQNCIQMMAKELLVNLPVKRKPKRVSWLSSILFSFLSNPSLSLTLLSHLFKYARNSCLSHYISTQLEYT